MRNNLFNKRRFLFPAFNFDVFDLIGYEDGEISWNLLRNEHEMDEKLRVILEKHLNFPPKPSPW